jgi:hypothetical protein
MKPAPAGLQSPSSARNQGPILQLLKDRLPQSGIVVEIAAGAGEHAMWFAEALPHLTWQPTDRDPTALKSIDAWRLSKGLPNLKKPIALDAAYPQDWLIGKADAIVCINMTHIAPWAATVGLLEGAGKILPSGGMLFIYGPFLMEGVETAPSNIGFDIDLRQRNPEWGLRDVRKIQLAASPNQLVLSEIIKMPVNNLSLVFHKR